MTGCISTHDIVLCDDCLRCSKKKKKILKERFADRVKKWGTVVETGQWRGNGKGEQGTGLTYMRWVGLQGGDTLLWVGSFPFREIGLQAWAGLIHRHGPTGPRRLPAFQGWGAGGVRVVWTAAGDLIDIGCDLPPERGVLALQRLQLEETVSNTLRGAFSKASFVPCADPLYLYSITSQPTSQFLKILILDFGSLLLFCQSFDRNKNTSFVGIIL